MTEHNPELVKEISEFQKDIKKLRENAEKLSPLKRKIWRARAFVCEKVLHMLLNEDERKLLL